MQPSRRNFGQPLVMAGLLFSALAISSGRTHAQNVESLFLRAQQTLTEIKQLLLRIEARQQGAVQGKPVAAAEAWKPLFDGKSLAGWKRTEFAGGGKVHVETAFRGGPPAIVVDSGATLSGFNWSGEAPKWNYEIALEVMKIEGTDFICGLTFPVGDSHASLILGGWGGGVVGISSIDGHDASENETTKYMDFPKDKWFKVRMRVTPDKLESWLDEKKIVDQVIIGRKIMLRYGEISRSVPIGISTYQTSAAFREIKMRKTGGE